jgi:formylglycine-generating enzyme required for sulfatase activity
MVSFLQCFPLLLLILTMASMASGQLESPTAPALESADKAESLKAMITVPAGRFEMGRPYYLKLPTEELPVHTVWLDEFQIGKYLVTNELFVDVLNWALSSGFLKNNKGDPYTGGVIYAYGQPVANPKEAEADSEITFINNIFTFEDREGHDGQLFSLADHPVIRVSWHGAVCYCNWRSMKEGLQPCYDTETWTRYEPVRNGYRLPTEAEWERTAAWDGEKHWRYGMTSDDIDFTKANYNDLYLSSPNPLGLKNKPYTTPVGWYNGINPVKLSTPEALTVDAHSPIGAYDMCGNVSEWCHDWYFNNYYKSSPKNNPAGPAAGKYRVVRGGNWQGQTDHTRSAFRNLDINEPYQRYYYYGFRIARLGGNNPEEMYHPFDANHDSKIELEEKDAAIENWQQGNASLIDVIRGLYLWTQGGDYHYNAEREAPLCWEPVQ